VSSLAEPAAPAELALESALEQIAGWAGGYDAAPRFPAESFAALRGAGVPQLAGKRGSASFAAELSLIRAVAASDASVARILDGHFNGVERLAMCVSGGLRDVELALVRSGELLLGVWGADPSPGEGPPARLVTSPGGGLAVSGLKTFCSGAGGVQRALVVVRDAEERRRLVYLDPSEHVEIDRRWYRASGLRASESHRVEFHETPVLAVLGGVDELVRQPWLARDSLRTAATWAGIADGLLAATRQAVAPVALDDLRLHAVGRMRLAQASIDRWLEHACAVLGDEHALEDAKPSLLAGECRLAIAEAARTIAAESARVCGSRALAGGGALDRGRRDLDLFLLQHRLDPVLVELGAAALAEGRE
jgi:alkylation response protein AidB-like acyl-CoA dehydrogenase